MMAQFRYTWTGSGARNVPKFGKEDKVGFTVMFGDTADQGFPSL